MIHSSFFHDDSSVWEPKLIRPYLCISEDQLNLLSNLPEWSKEKDSSSALRLESGTLSAIDNSQVSKSSEVDLLTETAKQQKAICNSEYFTKQSQDLRIVHSKQLRTRKRTKSFSSFERSEIQQEFYNIQPLKRVLSAPDILQKIVYLGITSNLLNQYKESPHIKEAAVLEKSDLLIPPNSEKQNKRDLNLSVDLFIAASGSVNSMPNPMIMDVAAELPVNVPICAEKNLENGIVFETADVVAVKLASTGDNAKVFENLSDSSRENNGSKLTVISDKTVVQSDNNKLEALFKQATSFANNVILGKNGIQKIDEKTNISDDSQVKMELDMDKGDSELSKELKEQESDVQINESCNKPVHNLVNNEIHIQDKILIQENQDILNKPVLTAETVVPVKRKSESKSRTSKKRKPTREKHGLSETRNVKRVGEISYTVEEIKCMLEIMKQFL